MIDADGMNNTRVYTSKGFDLGGMDWSSSGDWIVFTEFEQIFRIKSSGPSLTQLTSSEQNAFPS